MNFIADIIFLALDLLMFAVFAHVVMSWLVGFEMLNPRNPIVSTIWRELGKLLDPIYAKIRRFVPNIGMLDLSPLVLLFGIYAARAILSTYL